MDKDFCEFIESIDCDTYDTIIFSAGQAMATTTRTGIKDQSFFIALELLKRYHNWIKS